MVHEVLGSIKALKVLLAVNQSLFYVDIFVQNQAFVAVSLNTSFKQTFMC